MSNDFHPLRRRLMATARVAAAFVWRRPLVAAVVLSLLWVLLLRLVWEGFTGRSFAQLNEQIRQRGEPAEWRELKIDPLPDSENGLLLIDKAAGLDDRSTPYSSNNSYPDYPPYGAQWEQAAASSDQTNNRVFQLIRQSRQFAKGQSLQTLPASLAGLNFRNISGGRAVAGTLTDGALYRHIVGDDVESIDRILDVLHVGDLTRQDEFVVCQLVAIGIDSLAQSRAQIIAPGLRTGDPAVRQKMRESIQVLQNERPIVDCFHNSLPVERVLGIDVGADQSSSVFFLRPLSEMNRARNLRYANAAMDARAASSMEDVTRILLSTNIDIAGKPGDSTEPNNTSRYSRWFDETYMPYRRYYEQLFRVLGDRRTAALSLALQLYHADHHRWPQTLQELAPAYISTVPADPFHADGRPIGYVVQKGGLPDRSDRPLLYFEAAGTSDVEIDTEPMYDWQSDPLGAKKLINQYRDVTCWQPKIRRWELQNPAPSTMPTTDSSDAPKDNASKPNAPGEETKKEGDPK